MAVENVELFRLRLNLAKYASAALDVFANRL
jgi:hypothetical protein